MTTSAEMTFKCTSRSQKWHQSKAIVYDFLLVVYSNFCRITHRFWEIWCETVHWPWNMPQIIDSCITWKLSWGHVGLCKMFGRQWTKEAKIAIFNHPTHSHLTRLAVDMKFPIHIHIHIHRFLRGYPWTYSYQQTSLLCTCSHGISSKHSGDIRASIPKGPGHRHFPPKIVAK